MNEYQKLVLEALNTIIADTTHDGHPLPEIYHKIALALNPPTNNLAEKRAEEMKVEGCGEDSGFISMKLQREYKCGETNPTTNKVVLCSDCSQSGRKN